MTRAVAYRLPDDMVTRIKDASAQAGLSATAYVREAIEARLGAPTILDQPMEPLQPTGDVPRDTPQPVLETCALDLEPVVDSGMTVSVTAQMLKETEWQRDTCAHPFRDEQNICRVCGEQR